eukprot:TRINITY_DN6584_c0_g1_i2.p1 TRINITY_DN6584_c0_g1~~TRINITY_DN6584_c0_g1_i2.p1  ORF type:complete len:210 (+),score=41.08 TRINITY_DN6584_c0_g1_i2:589-1218(+)
MNTELAAKAIKVLGPLSLVSLLGVVIGGSAWLSPFYWHPVMMTVGYVILMSHGVLTATIAVNTMGDQRLQLLKKHMLVQILANLCVVGGLVAIYQNKELHGKQHFTTPHAKMGLFALGLSFYSPILGIFSFRSLGLSTCLPNAAINRLKSSHRVVGSLTIVTGLLTALYGVYLHLPGYPQYLVLLTLLVATAVHIYFIVVKNQKMPVLP